jgi:Protein of unknown function (DUF2934)
MAKNTNRRVGRGPALHYGADTSGCPIECVPDLIRKRAYQLFEARGRQPGHELEDWLQAEGETNRHLGI